MLESTYAVSIERRRYEDFFSIRFLVRVNFLNLSYEIFSWGMKCGRFLESPKITFIKQIGRGMDMRTVCPPPPHLIINFDAPERVLAFPVYDSGVENSASIPAYCGPKLDSPAAVRNGAGAGRITTLTF